MWIVRPCNHEVIMLMAIRCSFRLSIDAGTIYLRRRCRNAACDASAGNSQAFFDEHGRRKQFLCLPRAFFAVPPIKTGTERFLKRRAAALLACASCVSPKSVRGSRAATPRQVTISHEIAHVSQHTGIPTTEHIVKKGAHDPGISCGITCDPDKPR
ncbi:hypothetical protein BD410DRAFT_151813 [Rickenella mellea]|uniref:Uncharacterized protein n=1 Tax=Rickenella mellea TaxID=50990 RepID=A0A4Y7Q831_9AGAM|nr:hypothetical protein BD410DRAFT_151813 [Rickenella mellea]